jgi:endogenous inhibitor of DNA gyrase (YacG/DUF329 family)
MKCPICKKTVKLGDPEMPFCSERCRDVDLGKWANEEYRIPVVNQNAPVAVDPDEEPVDE